VTWEFGKRVVRPLARQLFATARGPTDLDGEEQFTAPPARAALVFSGLG